MRNKKAEHTESTSFGSPAIFVSGRPVTFDPFPKRAPLHCDIVVNDHPRAHVALLKFHFYCWLLGEDIGKRYCDEVADDVGHVNRSKE